MSVPAFRQVETPALSIAASVSGPEHGAPVLLLHGWPDAPSTWDAVLPALHAAGHRTVVPFGRGFGSTRFRDPAAFRSGEPVALAADALALADALGLDRFAVVGHDWGARAAYTAAALAPERVRRIAVLSTAWNGLDLGWPAPEQNHAYWYQWLIGTPRGAHVLEHDREAFTRYLWRLWSPGWPVPEHQFRAALAAFDNPDWPAITAHSYRSRWELAPRDPAHAAETARIAADPVIRVPTLLLHGSADPVSLPAGSADQAPLFAAGFERLLLPGLGHFPQRQDPDAVASPMLRFLAG